MELETHLTDISMVAWVDKVLVVGSGSGQLMIFDPLTSRSEMIQTKVRKIKKK